MVRRRHTRNGAAYAEAGTGELLVLIHGVGMRLEAWAPQVAVLSASHRVIAVDMPGHGESRPLNGEARLETFVGWLSVFLDDLALDRVSIAGHSMGALIAGGAAATFGDRVARVALLNGVYRRDAAASAAVIARAQEMRTGKVDLEGPLLRWFGEGSENSEAYGLTRQFLSTVDRAAYATAYTAFAHGDATYADRFAEIRCPALFLTGADDPNSTPAMAEAMARATPAGTALAIAGHRHMVNLTAPDRVNAILSDWMSKGGGIGLTNAAFDARALRDAFGAFTTGVTVVTTHDNDGKPIGFTANSFASVSLDPPLLLVCLAKTSRNFASVTQAPGFAVNILSETQKDVSNTFARPVEDRFANVIWQKGPHGSPVFADVAAWFDCATDRVIDAGDHVILIGRVTAFDNSGRNGLGYARGSYFTPALAAKAVSAAAAAEGEVHLSAVVERDGQVLLVGDDVLSLPSCAMAGGEPVETLRDFLRGITGLSIAIGFLYSVYESRADGRQHIVYRATASEGMPTTGRFLPPSDLPADIRISPATADILGRFALESAYGNFGVYVGTETAGRVHPVSIPTSGTAR